jgi:hypothetical protein
MGPMMARYVASKLWRGESYYLQVRLSERKEHTDACRDSQNSDVLCDKKRHPPVPHGIPMPHAMPQMSGTQVAEISAQVAGAMCQTRAFCQSMAYPNPCYIMLCHAMLHTYVIPYPVPRYTTPCHAMPCHAMPHAMPYPCHATI